MQPVFTETQRFNKWWHYLLAGFPSLLIVTIFSAVWLEDTDKPDIGAESIVISSALLITVLAFLWFLLLKLETHISQTGIVVNFAWMPFCRRNISWSEIKSISVIDYSPLSDYGGWGVRYSLTGNGWCYNVAGDRGIKLFYQNGKPFLIGTQRPEEAKNIIDHFMKP